MTDERRQRILAVADELEQQGLVATNSSVYTRILGYRPDVVQVLKERRALQAGGDVAVAEAEEAPEPEETVETPAAVLQEDLAQLEMSYESWHLALERLWQIETEGPLSEANFGRKQWLEYQMVQNLQAQERLRPLLEQARLREAVRAAQVQHDALVPAALVLAEELVQNLANLTETMRRLAAQFEAQIDGLIMFRSHEGRQQFELPSGRDQVAAFFAALYPQDPRAYEAVRLLLDHPLTVGRGHEALDTCPRLYPFSETAITRYLEGIHS